MTRQYQAEFGNSRATIGRVFDSGGERLMVLQAIHTLAVRLYLGETASSSMDERCFLVTRVWTTVSALDVAFRILSSRCSTPVLCTGVQQRQSQVF